MGKGIILGIDFSREYTQLAFLDEDNNPKSIAFGTEDNYLIPTAVCYNKFAQEWSSGQEAINKSKYSGSIFCDDLTEIMLDERRDREEVEQIIYVYFSFLFDIASKKLEGRKIKNVVISLNQVYPTSSELLYKVLSRLGISNDNAKIISHTESFVYFVLNQNKDIWINKVLYLYFDRNEFSLRKLNVVKGKKPYVADVDMESLEEVMTFRLFEYRQSQADKVLAEYMDEYLKKDVVSGIYLSGEAFYSEGWKESLEILCRNRRVFIGNNLIVKGAAYGARELFHVPLLEDYLISCKGRTRVKVTMNLRYKEQDSKIVLSNIGEYWYNASSCTECIAVKPNIAVFEIHDVISHSRDTFTIDISDFPERPDKTTRMEVTFKYLEEHKFRVEIKDLGFGDFFKSSGMVVAKEISI